MRLIDLPITLRELAVKRQIQEGDQRNVYRGVDFAIHWYYTPEGYDFWKTANEGLFSKTLKHQI